MWFSVSHQFAVIIYSLIIGVFLGIIYDCVRLTRILSGVGCYSRLSASLYEKRLPLIRKGRNFLRRRAKNGAASGAFIFVGDIIFALLCAAVYSIFLFHANRGQNRWYFILASGCGFFVYYFTVSKFVLTVLETSLFFIKAALRYAAEILLFPFRITAKFLYKIWKIAVVRIFSPIRTRICRRRMIKNTENVLKGLLSDIKFPDDV